MNHPVSRRPRRSVSGMDSKREPPRSPFSKVRPFHRSRTFLHSSVFRFLVVGGLNTVATLLAIFVTSHFLGLDTLVANAIGYVLGLALSFALNKQWTFRSASSSVGAAIRFLLVFLFAYLANFGTILLCSWGASGTSFWWQIIGMGSYSTLFYVGCRWYAFPRPLPTCRPGSDSPPG